MLHIVLCAWTTGRHIHTASSRSVHASSAEGKDTMGWTAHDRPVLGKKHVSAALDDLHVPIYCEQSKPIRLSQHHNLSCPDLTSLTSDHGPTHTVGKYRRHQEPQSGTRPHRAAPSPQTAVRTQDTHAAHMQGPWLFDEDVWRQSPTCVACRTQGPEGT